MTTPLTTVNAGDVARITKEFARAFPPSSVKWKPAMVKNGKAMALAYIDVRVVQTRLDKVAGINNWRDEYTHLPGGEVECRLSVRIGGEWITKADVGSPSEQPDAGDRTKAAVSDALKRAAVKWGIGRYLYRLPRAWADYDERKRQIVRPPQLPPWALPEAIDADEESEPDGDQPAGGAKQPGADTTPAGSAELRAGYERDIAAAGDRAKLTAVYRRFEEAVKAGRLGQTDKEAIDEKFAEAGKRFPKDKTAS